MSTARDDLPACLKVWESRFFAAAADRDDRAFFFSCHAFIDYLLHFVVLFWLLPLWVAIVAL